MLPQTKSKLIHERRRRSFMWPSCLCDSIVYVTQLFMWPSCLCDPIVYVAQLFMWPSLWPNCLCDPIVYVTQLFMWPNCLCDPIVYVTQLFMWPSCSCDPIVYVTQLFMWPNSLFSSQIWSKDESKTLCVISGFFHEVAENCALLGYYAASSGNFLPTFRDNLWGPIFGVLALRMWPSFCPETSVKKYHYSMFNNPEERSSHLYWFLRN